MLRRNCHNVLQEQQFEVDFNITDKLFINMEDARVSKASAITLSAEISQLAAILETSVFYVCFSVQVEQGKCRFLFRANRFFTLLRC